MLDTELSPSLFTHYIHRRMTFQKNVNESTLASIISYTFSDLQICFQSMTHKIRMFGENITQIYIYTIYAYEYQ